MNSKGVVQELVMTGSTMVYKNTPLLEIPLRTVGLLLRLPNSLVSTLMLSYSGLSLLCLSYRTKHWNCWDDVRVCTFLFRTRSTLLHHSEDQVLKLLLSVEILSYSGLGLLSSRTKYQISHTAGRHIPGVTSLPAPRCSLHPPHWGCSGAAQVPLTSSLHRPYCHTTCPLDITL